MSGLFETLEGVLTIVVLHICLCVHIALSVWVRRPLEARSLCPCYNGARGFAVDLANGSNGI